jgi:hypothetical protein
MKSNNFMTVLLSCALLLLTQRLAAQKITLTRTNLDSKVSAITEKEADNALRIANYIYNSKEFQDSLRKRDFAYSNICEKCNPNREPDKPRFKGQAVLDKLFSKPKPTLNLYLRKTGLPPPAGKECFALGFTCPDEHYITSYYKNIMCELGKELPFEYAYGIHICHEYMHEIGYCHTTHNDDVAEAAGLIALHLMNRWYKAGVRVQ